MAPLLLIPWGTVIEAPGAVRSVTTPPAVRDQPPPAVKSNPTVAPEALIPLIPPGVKLVHLVPWMRTLTNLNDERSIACAPITSLSLMQGTLMRVSVAGRGGESRSWMSWIGVSLYGASAWAAAPNTKIPKARTPKTVLRDGMLMAK